MKEIYILRHAEKDNNGVLTPAGEDTAKSLAGLLPRFTEVYSSGSDRAIATAKLLTDREPIIDDRAAYATATQDKSDAINQIAAEDGSTFLEAALKYADLEVLVGINTSAKDLDRMISEILAQGNEDQRALIVSHDLSISPAMALHGMPLASIDFLDGYVISNNGQIQPFVHSKF